MRKPWMHLTVTLLTFLGILGLFLLANGNTPVLDPSAPLPDDLADRGYALFGQPLDDDRSYVFTLRAGTRQPSLTLVLAAMRPFHVTLDGVQLYEYSEQMPYSRVHQIPLGELEAGTYRLKIHTSSGQRWIKGLLTTPERANGYQTTAGIIALLSIGMHLMMILNSLFLFLNKTSERYLLLQTGIGTISLVSAFFTSDVGQMPFNDGTYVIIQHFINGTSAPLWVFFCILIAGYTVPPRRGRLVYPLLGAVILLNTCLYRFSQPLLLELLMFPLFLLGLILLSLARAWGQTGTLLLVCYAVRFALSYYNRATNWGLLPNSELLVYLYTPQLGNLLLLLACTLEVNRRFAGKFIESERLVGELEQTNAHLDAIVEERTRQLREEQRQKHNMLLNTYHDLRSPLFSARGCADMLHAPTEEDAECLDILKEKLDFLSRLTEDLFLIAKLEDGKITFAQCRVDLHALCSTIGESAALQAESRGISFSWDCVPGLEVTGDGFRLKQALENLLANAFRFTPGGGEVSLSLRRTEEGALVAVRDSGKGIPPAQLPHVFERYYQGDRNRPDASAGLGLSIAQEIIKRHGGRIWVESEEGRGSAFFICLPLA